MTLVVDYNGSPDQDPRARVRTYAGRVSHGCGDISVRLFGWWWGYSYTGIFFYRVKAR